MSEPIYIAPLPWMVSEETKLLMNTLLEDSGSARFVGGCVRDSILHKAIKDIDVGTSHKPEKAMELLKKQGIRVIPTGIKHGTITAVVGKSVYEITTLRRDIFCDGRHAEVEYTDDWKEDASRRDFTINAMSMDISGGIYDYFTGMADIEDGVIRFVGDAEKRVQEDYLRILRFFRFQAHYGRSIMDDFALHACRKFADNIETLSGERIQAEMLKLLSVKLEESSLLYYVMIEMLSNGILRVLFGAEKFERGLKVFRSIIEADTEWMKPEYMPNPYLRLAGLIYDITKDGNRYASAEERSGVAAKIAERWQLSNNGKETLSFLVNPPYNFSSDADEKTIKTIMRKVGRERFQDMVVLEWGLEAAPDKHVPERSKMFRKVFTFAERWQIPIFPLSGDDIIGLGILPGKRIGELLSYAENIWEEQDYKPTANALIEEVEKKIATEGAA